MGKWKIYKNCSLVILILILINVVYSYEYSITVFGQCYGEYKVKAYSNTTGYSIKNCNSYDGEIWNCTCGKGNNEIRLIIDNEPTTTFDFAVAYTLPQMATDNSTLNNIGLYQRTFNLNNVNPKGNPPVDIQKPDKGRIIQPNTLLLFAVVGSVLFLIVCVIIIFYRIFIKDKKGKIEKPIINKEQEEFKKILEKIQQR